MQFLAPLFWIASATISIPIFIHMIRRERSKDFLFSSLRHLRPITRKSFKYLKVRNPWVLLLRALFLLLLVAAFSRPYIPTMLTSLSAVPAATATVVLVDSSHSMSVGGSFDRAIHAARGFISGLGAHDVAALVTFADSPRILSGLTNDGVLLERLLEGKVEQTFRTTNYIPALRSADKLLSDRMSMNRTILLISDLQKVGYRQDESFRLSPGVQLKVVDVGTPERGVVAVTDTHLDYSSRAAKRKAKVTTRLVNLGRDQVEARTTLVLNGRPERNLKVRFGLESTRAVEFKNVSWPEGSVRGVISAEVGDLTSKFYFVSEGSAREAVVIIEGPKRRRGSRPAFYLSRALATAERGKFAVRTVPLSSAGSLSLREFRTIFIVGVDTLPGAVAENLEEAVREGRGLVIACGPNLALNAFNSSFSALVPATLERVVSRDREPVGILGNLDYSHPIFKVFSESKTGNFLASRFHGYYAVSLTAGGDVLGRFDDGNLALVEGSFGRGRVLLFSSSLDNSWNDLPLNPVYLPFVHQMVAYAGSIAAQRNWFWVGESIPVEAKMTPGGGIDRTNPSVYVTSPGRPDSELPLRDPIFTFEQPGFYAFRSNQDIVYHAANIRPDELDFSPLDVDQLVAALTAPPSVQPRGENDGVTRNSKKQNKEYGYYLLSLSLLVLLTELAVANRSVRQVL